MNPRGEGSPEVPPFFPRTTVQTSEELENEYTRKFVQKCLFQKMDFSPNALVCAWKGKMSFSRNSMKHTEIHVEGKKTSAVRTCQT
ncbi:hypothetical protein POVWA2_031770 [Plasmodium ovale wallikeri]|uniref:Uncharacterized protein n=1 Tax=Plasmodium ovale wallikeri TaxID=864142 RepID=A0A1A8YZ64_PLAOA|nr:hypothetical protein POVWA1_032050 [Plasmodium ovale wallikeri]SBT36745.1 hypothetical protein POVWA2_031770 [Plasmodium ovale wallikeri]